MKLKKICAGALACVVCLPLQAAMFQMEFWTNDQASNSTLVVNGDAVPNVTTKRITENPFVTGTFEIADATLGVSNGFIPLTSSDLLSFLAVFGSVSFNLPGDLASSGIGVRLDADGNPFRFDIPQFSTSNGGRIFDGGEILPGTRNLLLWDRDPISSSRYFTEDDGEGWVTVTRGTAQNLGLATNGLVSEWATNAFSETGFGEINGFLRISSVSAVPVPAAVWLFGSALAGMLGIRLKKVS